MKLTILASMLIGALFIVLGMLLHWETRRVVKPWDCVRCEYMKPHQPDYLVNL